ncbi:MAG: YqaJ viral recombinase family protein [Xenophilus sp.]
MEILNLQQGTSAWAAHRATALNASDAPVMLGVSPYRSRSLFVRERATGLVDAEIDQATARRFADGHRFEALARPLAEQIVGEELFPVVGKTGKYSASFDGLTLMEDTAFEHKTLGESLRYTPWDEGNGDHLPLHYRIQMEHQCMVCPSIERVLFMASRWAEDGTLLEERHCWYTPDPALRARIVAGWEQFEADVAAYVPETPKAAPVVAAPQEALPAVSVRVDGQLAIVSNLPAFGAALKSFIDRIPADPSTDQEFADTEAACKTLKRAEEALEAADSNALAQFADMDTMRRLVSDYRALARTTRLQREKLVALRKDQLRAEIVTDGQKAAAAHTQALNQRLGGNFMPTIPADFGGAIKGKKNLDSMRDAVAAELVRAKIAANEVADRIDGNLKLLDEQRHPALFPDMATLVLKQQDDLSAIITARITQHAAEQAAAMERERERIRAEEQEKARREADSALRASMIETERSVQSGIADGKASGALDPTLADELAATAAALRADGVAGIDSRTVINDAKTSAAQVEGGMLTLGLINARIAPLSITVAGLNTLGFQHVGKDKAAFLFRASAFPLICEAIAKRALLARHDYLRDA